MPTATCLDCPAQFPAKGRKKRCPQCQKAFAKAKRNSLEAVAQRRTHFAVKHAIAAGLLERRSCEAVDWRNRRCGRTPAYGHHEDYSRPLDVVWLCGYHHKSRHADLTKTPIPPLIIDRPGQPEPDRDW